MKPDHFHLDKEQLKLYAITPKLFAFIERVANWDFELDKPSLRGSEGVHLDYINQAQKEAFKLLKEAEQCS